MHFLIIALNVAAFATLIGWFRFSTTIFTAIRDKTKTNFQKSFVVVSYVYPFILAFCLYNGWDYFENGYVQKAIQYCASPMLVFLAGWLINRFLSKR